LRGWFKVNRDIIKRAIFDDAELLRLYIYLQADAYYEPYEKLIDGEVVQLVPGQGTFGTRQLAGTLNTNHSTTYKRLKKLEKLGFIKIESYREMSVFTLLETEIEKAEKVNTDETGTGQETQGLRDLTEEESKQCGNEKETQSKTLKEGRSNKENIYTSEFELWWEDYPKKAGKADARKAWVKLRKSGKEVEEITLYRDRYITKLNEDKTEKQFILNGSTFLNGRWEDYKDDKPEQSAVERILGGRKFIK